jgi:hypothetical protein
VYTLSLNAAPQQWGEGNQRYFEASLLETDGTELWSSGDVAIPLYNKEPGDEHWGGEPWPAECTFLWDIPASAFTAVAPGEPLRVRIAHTGSNRGMFIDNVLLTYAKSQPFIIPEPTTLLIWSLLAALGVGCGRRRRKK